MTPTQQALIGSLIAAAGLLGEATPDAVATQHALDEEQGRAAREMVMRPLSSGSRNTSSTLRSNSGNSSRNSTPWWASEISPGRESLPPPARAAAGSVVGWPRASSAQPSGIGRPSRACFITSDFAMVEADWAAIWVFHRRKRKYTLEVATPEVDMLVTNPVPTYDCDLDDTVVDGTVIEELGNWIGC